MDSTALRTDLDAALKKLPPTLLAPLALLAKEALGDPDIKDKMMGIMEDLKPHVMAGFAESMAGVLDTDEIEKVVLEVFDSYMPGLAK